MSTESKADKTFRAQVRERRRVDMSRRPFAVCSLASVAGLVASCVLPIGSPAWILLFYLMMVGIPWI